MSAMKSCVLAFVYACICVCAHTCVCVYMCTCVDLCGNGEFQPRRRLCLGLPREVEAIAMLVALREMGSKRTFLYSSLCDLGQVTSVPRALFLKICFKCI
uniref:Secreted protein n=1 Tax=Cercocebus atys TaxID=9531 RepID=A0A2K5MB15_CERAT